MNLMPVEGLQNFSKDEERGLFALLFFLSMKKEHRDHSPRPRYYLLNNLALSKFIAKKTDVTDYFKEGGLL
jgi:hypothetical protein